MSKHPITGRDLPQPGDLMPGKILELDETEFKATLEPWLIFGPWTIYSEEPPTAQALGALIVALAELAKLAAVEEDPTKQEFPNLETAATPPKRSNDR
jgi:hypothetical protein